MDNLGKWKLVKVGFWLGIGFIIPQLVVLYSGTALTMLAMPSMMEASFESEDGSVMSSLTSNFDRAEQIKINNYREQKNGNQLLILGSIVNKGDKKASSIQLEAELTDEGGNFVYECSEYISNDLKPGDIENFQIKCGCGKNPVPEYANVNVRVISARGY
ncbi:MAG: hypothetical protein GY820_35830 [Gammaproteobacteria bacterium]|nr:hypothetical protein [Gammaproteobacteria bacterium]